MFFGARHTRYVLATAAVTTLLLLSFHQMGAAQGVISARLLETLVGSSSSDVVFLNGTVGATMLVDVLETIIGAVNAVLSGDIWVPEGYSQPSAADKEAEDIARRVAVRTASGNSCARSHAVPIALASSTTASLRESKRCSDCEKVKPSRSARMPSISSTARMSDARNDAPAMKKSVSARRPSGGRRLAWPASRGCSRLVRQRPGQRLEPMQPRTEPTERVTDARPVHDRQAVAQNREAH